MKVSELIKELEKFDGDLECYAYEGEVTGIIINADGCQGVIYCSEGGQSRETDLI